MSEKDRNEIAEMLTRRYTPQMPVIHGYPFPLPENARDPIEFLPPEIKDPIVMPPGDIRDLYGDYIDPAERA